MSVYGGHRIALSFSHSLTIFFNRFCLIDTILGPGKANPQIMSHNSCGSLGKSVNTSRIVLEDNSIVEDDMTEDSTALDDESMTECPKAGESKAEGSMIEGVAVDNSKIESAKRGNVRSQEARARKLFICSSHRCID